MTRKEYIYWYENKYNHELYKLALFQMGLILMLELGVPGFNVDMALLEPAGFFVIDYIMGCMHRKFYDDLVFKPFMEKEKSLSKKLKKR